MSLKMSKQVLTLLAAVIVIGVVIVIVQALIPEINVPKVRSGAASTRPPQVATSKASGDPIPELAGISAWLNSESLTVASLRGKVVLVDFWTYSCVNCVRTLPHLKEWDAKYGSRGLVILGVHSPEFDFEKDVNNIRKAVQQYGVTWPVAVDNDHASWAAYGNRYWPHKYLADSTGTFRYDHIGEGGYVETEQQIRALLIEAGQNISDIPLGKEDIQDAGALTITRELYAGTSRAFGGYLGNPAVDASSSHYVDPGKHDDGKFYLSGSWQTASEFVRATGPGYAAISYRSREANAVLAPEEASPVTVVVELDGKPLSMSLAGRDVTFDASGRSTITADGSRLYGIVRGDEQGTHELKLMVDSAGLQLYTFTFSP